MKRKEKNADESTGQLKAHLIECQNALEALKESERDLRLSEEKFRLMFDNANDLVMHVDRYGIVIDANRKVEELIGKGHDRIVGKHFTDFGNFEPDTVQAVKQFFREAVDTNTTISREVELKHANGSTVIIDPSISLIKRDGQVEGVFVMMKDITERKKSEETMAELYNQERELRKQIETEMNRRIDFTRTLAHELKTPLTPVLASVDSLLSELDEKRLISLARNISQGANSLNSRIDELLDLARGEIGMLELNLDSVDFLQILQEAADSVAPIVKSRGQSLTLDLPTSAPQVQLDVSRIQQVLLNLLSNAIKFTPQKGTIKLKAREKESSIIIEVQDTGHGISKEQQQRVFEPYRRLASAGRQTGGLGLGLALCKTLIELHGGEIWVRSHVGKGATFGFSLPLEHSIQQAVGSSIEGYLWKVLIIEDEQEIIDSVSLAFEKDWPEAELISVLFGRSGLDLVESEEPDIVLLDLELPDTDGIEVLKSIRLFSSVPVIILSVRQGESDMIRGLELGANDYITKPFRKKELLSRLKVQLRNRMSTREESPIICGSLCLDPTTFQLTYGGREISLTVVEGRIMQQLMTNAGHVTTHARLAEAVWGDDHNDSRGTVESLRVYIRYLRRKLEVDSSKPRLILTKSGVGYSLAKPG
ncbi:ATP-binding protein [Chloroflexota bacterium]